MQFIESSKEERQIFNAFYAEYKQHIMLNAEESRFLFSLVFQEIQRLKEIEDFSTRKLRIIEVCEDVENIGRASSLILFALNFLLDTAEAHLYSIASNALVNKKNSSLQVFIPTLLEQHSEFKAFWTICKGNIFESLERITKQKEETKSIDILFINTGHTQHLALLDFLLLLPYMRENALVIKHDANLEKTSQKKFQQKESVNITKDILFRFSKSLYMPAYSQRFLNKENRDDYTNISFPHTGALRLTRGIWAHIEEFITFFAHSSKYILRDEYLLAVQEIFRKFYSHAHYLCVKKLFITNNEKITQDLNQMYDSNFQKERAQYSYSSALLVIKTLQKYYKPKSVIDIGCGSGTWLKAWTELGTRDIRGLDVSILDEKYLYVAKEYIQNTNLETHRNTSTKKYDLAMSLEVAEHIHEKHAKDFIENLTSYSDIILFSAALPKQTGTGHINCQFPSYWIQLFEEKDYICFDFLRKDLLQYADKVNCCYTQNIYIFVKQERKNLFIEQNCIPIKDPFVFYHIAYVDGIIASYQQKILEKEKENKKLKQSLAYLQKKLTSLPQE